MPKVKSSKCSQRQNRMAASKHWCKLEVDTIKHEDLNLVFANQGMEDEIYPLTTMDITKAQ
jgi:hypothetical protein